MKNGFDTIEFKKRTISIWDEIAPRYHKRWAKNDTGPFYSTSVIIKLAKIKPGDWVLDLGCGTGVLTKRISSKVGSQGRVIGADVSSGTIKIAKKWNKQKENVDFVISDGEKFCFQEKFDVVTCQYVLFFFPNAQKALQNLKECLKRKGVLALSVHGKKNSVPFFGSIVDAITKYIPDYVPPCTPPLDRFGTQGALKDEVTKCGFQGIKINKYVFKYSPGTFDDYWNGYLKYIAKPLREKLNTLTSKQKREVEQLVRKNTQKYTKRSGRIVFPWKVLILTAIKP